MNIPWGTPAEQFQMLNLLDYLSDLFTAASKDTFTRVEVLVVLNGVRSDQELFDPDVLIVQQVATAEIDSQPHN
jgi:hypothetical protein